MFSFAVDRPRGIAIFLFSGAVSADDRCAFGNALADFDARLAASDHPAAVLVNESREEALEGKPSACLTSPPYEAKETRLLAVVVPHVRGVLDEVRWIFRERHALRCVTSFQEAVAWIEECRGEALFPFFDGLLLAARSAVGEVTLS
jgi:hypothetical protein